MCAVFVVVISEFPDRRQVATANAATFRPLVVEYSWAQFLGSSVLGERAATMASSHKLETRNGTQKKTSYTVALNLDDYPNGDRVVETSYRTNGATSF